MNDDFDLLDGIPDPRLKKTLLNLKTAMDANPREIEPAPKPQTAEIIQLPLWGDTVRGTPNVLLRGALFSAIQSKDRKYMKREVLATVGELKIIYTGEQLNQTDLNVWEQAVHLARLHPLGNLCHFTAHSFLKSLGRSTGGDQHEQLKYEISRLSATDVAISYKEREYSGSLVVDKTSDDETKRYVLQLNPKILKLWRSGWTAVDWDQRLKLKRKPLALWLHGFYASHAKPYSMKVETLQKLSGSRNKDIYDFQKKLSIALSELVKIGAIKDFEIKDGLVYIKNVPSQSQHKYLSRAKSRRKQARVSGGASTGFEPDRAWR